jgi:hypothetical protein
MGTKNGNIFVEHKAVFPRKTDNIIACYMRITRNDDSTDYKVISIEEIQKLRKFSKMPDSKAWTIGLSGMVMSKCIKHAFRTYPKLRKGIFSELASNVVEAEETMIPIDYGIEPENKLPQQQIDDNSFVEDKNAKTPETVTYTYIEDDNF